MLRKRLLQGTLAIAMLLLSGCQRAPEPGLYNDRIGVAQQAVTSRDTQAEYWEEFNPYLDQEKFQTTLHSAELSLVIDATVTVENLPQYYTFQVDYFHPNQQEAKQIADHFYGENQYTLDEDQTSPYGEVHRFRAVNADERLNSLTVWQDSIYISSEQGMVDTSNRKLVDADDAGTDELIEQAQALIARCGLPADPVYGHPIVQYFDVGGETPVAHMTFLRYYEGLPVYPFETLSIGASYLDDQYTANTNLKGERLSLYFQEGNWLLNGYITREQSRQAVGLLPFSQIIASLQEQLNAYPPMVVSAGGMVPVTIREVWLAYVGVPVVDSQGIICAIEYRPSWIFTEGPNQENLYGRYLVAVDAVTGEIRSIWQ